ncbi:DUF654-domain-containing protein [Aureobasidium pullulans]|uniref:DUF654-domain-containing protein n=1 Tax=Aureobasidium pullulans TaxID=5580 RepID=A0A4S9Y9L3_AURPU|nr:DUF654-domain-containing protein [Aureobasidium pullulans]
MSSRALRKAQREREEQEQLRKLQEEHEEQDEDSEEEEAPAAAPPKQSLFAMLNEDGADDEDDAEDEDEDVHQDESEQEAEKPTPTQPTPKPSTKSKKKKKKAKKAAQPATSSKADASLDDIDLALKSLSTKASGTATPTNTADPNTNEVCRLLSIDTASLHAANEMRRLFGRAALEGDNDDDNNAGGRRRNRGGAQQAGLAAALGRRPGQGGRSDGLAALSRRRNIFIQGKEEWPVATSGGLGMEVVEKRSDGTVEYAFVHSRIYQDVQGQFETCVASMDPQRMVLLLQHNPYHISTLLQVSEIAKQERDHTTSGDLLERALFSFGRAVHSTFSANLQQGKARLDFRRPENREFWLAACRYISNLGMRSTWRTVYEWSKLLLSLDPENDPYCISLVIDQYAIRGRQPQNFLDLVNNPIFTTKWKHLPNVQLSRALAFIRVGNAAKGKQSLYTAVSRFPWVVARLFQELNLDPPPSVWGKSPRTDSEKLHSEVYAIRAKDLWNTPEASELLVEVSSAVSSEVPEPPVVDRDITLDEGRHILMSDMPTLIALLPRSITAKVTSASDPLPPQDNQATYTPASTQRAVQPPSGALGGAAESLRELQGLYRFFSELFPWFNPTGEGEERPQPSEEEIERRIAESGVSEEVIVQRTQRLMDLQQRLISVGEPEAGAEAAPAVDDE